MIGRLRGQLLSALDNLVLLDVGGVGYEVEVPDSTKLSLLVGPDGDAPELTLHTHLVVREDAQLLYGFLVEAERDLFRNLIRISGVGPKMGLAILATYAGADLARLVVQDDAKALTKVPGVGKKTADRLLVELRNRQDLLPAAEASPESLAPSAPRRVVDEVEQALVALGYKPQYASQVVQQIAADPDVADDTQQMLRSALQFLAQKSEVGQ